MKIWKYFIITCTLITLVACSGGVTSTDSGTDRFITQDFDRLFDTTQVHKITIEITQSEWNRMLQDMRDYASLFHGDLRSDTYFKANLIYEDDEGSVFVHDIGFRTKGNTSRVLPETSTGDYVLSHFKIKFNETFDYEKDSKTYKALNMRTVFGLDEINLKFNRNWDSSYISEIYSYQLFNSIGVMAPMGGLVDFSIRIGSRTTHYGVYNLFEPVDEKFLERRLDADELGGNLYKCLWQDFGPASLIPITNPQAIGIKDVNLYYHPAYDLKTNKKSPDYTDLKDFISQLNVYTGADFEQYMNDHFDIPSFIKYLAMGDLIGNPDDYRGVGNNYYLYHNVKTNQFILIPYDYDHSLGQGWISDALPNYTIGSNIYTWGSITNTPLPLSDKLLSLPKVQEWYEEDLEAYITDENRLFTYDSFLTTLNQYATLYEPYTQDGLQQLSFGPRNAEWYFTQKTADIQSQLDYYAAHPNARGGNK